MDVNLFNLKGGWDIVVKPSELSTLHGGGPVSLEPVTGRTGGLKSHSPRRHKCLSLDENPVPWPQRSSMTPDVQVTEHGPTLSQGLLGMEGSGSFH